MVRELRGSATRSARLAILAHIQFGGLCKKQTGPRGGLGPVNRNAAIGGHRGRQKIVAPPSIRNARRLQRRKLIKSPITAMKAVA